MTETNTESKAEKRGKAGVTLADVLGSELKATGADIPEGSYGAVLFGFSEPFTLKTSEKFRKPGQPEMRTLFDLRFGLFDKSGSVQELTKMVGVPDGGELNRKSNLYKALKSLKPEKFDKEGNLTRGTKLADFVGAVCVLSVGKNKDDWAEITAIGGPMDGAKYPTLDQCKELLTSSPDVPF